MSSNPLNLLTFCLCLLFLFYLGWFLKTCISKLIKSKDIPTNNPGTGAPIDRSQNLQEENEQLRTKIVEFEEERRAVRIDFARLSDRLTHLEYEIRRLRLNQITKNGPSIRPQWRS